MFNIGDRIVRRAAFLRSIGAYTGDICFEVGTVLAVKTCGSLTLLDVEWSICGTGSVNAANVILESKKHLEAV